MKKVSALLALLLLGCAQQGSNDLSGQWQVQQIAGASLGESVDIWIEVAADGESVSGFTGCNAFTSTLTTFGTGVSFSPPVEEAGECASMAAATDEARFLGVLPSVRRYVRHGRSLELLTEVTGSEALLRLRLTDAEERQ